VTATTTTVVAGAGAPPVSADRKLPDLVAAEAAAAALLAALGVDDSGPLEKTPARMARALEELLTPRTFDMTTFPNDEGYRQLVIERGIPFRSLCEHHLLPFTGRACVAYLPGEKILGLSSWPALWRCSLAVPRDRRGSPSRSPTGCTSSCCLRASGSSWSPSTCV
jgi:hypothetical protein